MKLKNLLSIASFITFFSISLLLGTLFTSSVFSGIFSKKIDSQTQAKIYEFLQKDRQLYREMSEKIQVVEIPDRLPIIKTYYEIRGKMDNSELPEDFQYAREKKILSDVEWVGFMYHLRAFNHNGIIKTEAQKEIVDEKIAESRTLDNNLVSVARRYGIKFDANNNLIEKK